jgi:lipoprotein NlpD
MDKIYKKIGLGISVIITITSCAFSRDTPAPVVNITMPTIAPRAKVAPVQTPAANAPAAEEITINKLDDEPEVINPPASPNAARSSAANWGGIPWLTPTTGAIINPYSNATKGVDIAGREGQAVVAAAEGKVAYSGNGLKGYGNLIIIKHRDNYLTAYSHNKVNLVKEADVVKPGQQIAEVGKSDSDRPLLHFELRHNGKPLNPTALFHSNN